MKEAVKVLGIGLVILGLVVTTNNAEALSLPTSLLSNVGSGALSSLGSGIGSGSIGNLFNGGGSGIIGNLFNRGGNGNTGYGTSPYGMMMPMMMMGMMRGNNGLYGNNTGTSTATTDSQYSSQLSSLDTRISSIENTVYGQSSSPSSGAIESWLSNLEQRVNNICLDVYGTGYTPPASTSSSSSSGLLSGLLGNSGSSGLLGNRSGSGLLGGNGLFGGLLGNSTGTNTSTTTRINSLEQKVDEIETDLSDIAVQSLSVQRKGNTVIKLKYYDYDHAQAEFETGTITHNLSYRPAEKTQRNLSFRVWYPISNGAVNPEAAPYPLIVFAHSQFQKNVPALEEIAAGIAKKGYIVCVVIHGSSSTVQKDTLTTPIYLDTPGDIQAIATEMSRLNNTPDSIFWGAIAEETVGIVGHALGAQTAEAVSGATAYGQKDYTDERVKAEVLLAPAGSTAAKALARIDSPAMLILVENDSTVVKANCKSVYDNVQAAKYLAVVQKTKISDLVNLGTEKEKQANIISAVVEYTAALFDHVLKQDNSAEKTLEQKAASFLFYDVDGE
ncbi:MAG: hypothetical protein V1662_03115 [Candidatus Omnitrophota bacterium]